MENISIYNIISINITASKLCKEGNKILVILQNIF